jgi:hypothetical protein
MKQHRARKDAERRFQQLIFEIGKTRSAVLRIGLQTIPEETMEQILAAATRDAKNYAALVAAGIDMSAAGQGSRAMRAVAETAVRWRAGAASFHMVQQIAAPTALAGVTIWALSTFLLVWFWVRHYLPLGPHYFRLWLFSWLFGEVIPLHFLDFPYKGRRYPILSVYLFLSDKVYYHSFPVCFWHYAGWGRFWRCWR